MGSHGITTVANPLADHEGTDQTGDRRVDVHHSAAGEIEGAVLEQIACGGTGSLGGGGIRVGIRTGPVPHHVRHRNVGEGEPDHGEQQHGRELHPLGESTDDEPAGNGGKGPLEHHIDELADPHPFAEGGGNRLGGHPDQQQLVERTVKGAPLGEGQRIAVDDPEHCDQAEQGEHLHQHTQHVLGAYQATVEQGQPRDGHQDHQGGRQHQPGVVSLVDGHGRGSLHHVGLSGYLFCPTWGGHGGAQRQQASHYESLEHTALSLSSRHPAGSIS